MAVESSNHNFKLPLGLQIDEISSDKLIQRIVRNFKPCRRVLATRQLEIYLKKITSHPEMRSTYIEKIKQLVEYELKKGVKYE